MLCLVKNSPLAFNMCYSVLYSVNIMLLSITSDFLSGLPGHNFGKSQIEVEVTFS